ncbi:Glycosyl hydrolases family 25 [Actinacidiphila alni]|uniref:Glycosyl hydrolases family 25 n=1 Tax=Actinacidiphila alni TaxID=380248 RepID=A0A1I2JD61_9ACTN|nr:glycoside hydrolase family 25 protein [Actinacidiphila alni]SFF51783.1 Glycosyl hydrolases family 25 [Actinacidiphila alni]
MATSRGLDVSSFQGTQDWKALARSGITFAFAKASEGEHTRDSRFAGHIGGIIAAGLVPGAYHFGWPNQNAAKEAANYVAAVKSHARRGFVHVLDLERRSDGANYSGRTAAQIRAYASAWITAVAKAFPGQRVGVYTSADDITNKHVPANSGFLWYPAYPSGAMSYAEAEKHARPAPSGQHPLFWQFTSTPLDRDLAYLSPADLRTWAANDPEDTLPEPFDVWAYKGQLNGKTDPHDAYSYLRGTNADVKTLARRLDALTATVNTLAKALAAANPAIDADTLLTQVHQAIDTAVTAGEAPE